MKHKIVAMIIILSIFPLVGCQTLDQWHDQSLNNQSSNNLEVNLEKTINSIRTMTYLADTSIEFIQVYFDDRIPPEIDEKLDELQEILQKIKNILLFLDSFNLNIN